MCQLVRCVSCPPTFAMLGPFTPSHTTAVVSLAVSAARDCVLVSSCGARLEVPGLLLALYSPLLAPLMGQGKGGVSLPLSLPEVRGLVRLLHGQLDQEGLQEVGEAAELLGITDLHSLNKRDDLDIVPGVSKERKKALGVMGPNNLYPNTLKHEVPPKPEEFTRQEMKKEDPAVKFTTKEAKAHLKTINIEELVTNESETLISDNYSSDDVSSEEESEPETSEAKKMRKTIFLKRKQRILPNKKFPCNNCTISYESKMVLMKHMFKAHHIPFTCEKCDLQFTENLLFKQHKRKNHPAFICPICGAAKFLKNQLDNHIEGEHQDGIICPHCKLLSKTQALLNAHINRLHSTRVYEKCIKCNYKTHIPYEMQGHFRRKHTDDTKETCHYCGEIFKGLKSHLKRTGCGGEVKTPKFPCSKCNMMFEKSELQRHDKRVHQRLKDRNCEHCPYATYSGYNMRIHITKMHVGQKLETEDCPHCDKVTTNLNYHIEMMHNEHFLANNTSTH